MRDGGEPGVPRFIGSGSGIHFIRNVYDVLARAIPSNRSKTGGSAPGDLVPGEEDQLVDQTPGDVATPGTRARAPFWQPGEIIHDAEAGLPSINFDNLVKWTKEYFENWHPAFPFLHGPEVLELLEHVGAHGIDHVAEVDAVVVRAIISISLADTRQMTSHQEPIPAGLLFSSLENVASYLVFLIGAPASLKNIQAAVCVELFLISMLKFNMASRLGGIIVRMAFHLGLHRCPRRYPNFSLQESYMRKRIWWSIYCLERMVCQSLGLPLDIRDDDVDVCFPSHELHKSSSDNVTSDNNQDGEIGPNVQNPNILLNCKLLSSRSASASHLPVEACPP